ncbi:cyclic-di-AMP receptor [Lacticaseibacillus zhaodongensis]|uniref:cyclic-di-AMP receptor n=1 Tax=Lacticaseibacillus zhaodongensis TaxID=2668065 RepID=UPI0012D2CB88|nr:cyclic-di-AMP receptor [Lacticaseibacillus zhaodongensis]
MKLVLAIIQDQDAGRLSAAFVDENVRATKLSSTGGFLRAGNSTFIVGVEDDRVQKVLEIIKNNCQARDEYTTAPLISVDAVSTDATAGQPLEVRVGGATVFVLPVDAFHRF